MSQKDLVQRNLGEVGFAPILIVIIVTLVGGSIAAGYFIYQNQTKTIPSIPTQSPKPSPSPITIDESTGNGETVDWKTYTNSKYTFKYPVRFGITKQTEQQTQVGVGSFVIEHLYSLTISTDPSTFIDYKSYKTNRVKLDNRDAIDFQFTDNSGYTYRIVQTVSSPKIELKMDFTDKELVPEFNHILSTFKFLP